MIPRLTWQRKLAVTNNSEVGSYNSEDAVNNLEDAGQHSDEDKTEGAVNSESFNNSEGGNNEVSTMDINMVLHYLPSSIHLS